MNAASSACLVFSVGLAKKSNLSFFSIFSLAASSISSFLNDDFGDHQVREIAKQQQRWAEMMEAAAAAARRPHSTAAEAARAAAEEKVSKRITRRSLEANFLMTRLFNCTFSAQTFQIRTPERAAILIATLYVRCRDDAKRPGHAGSETGAGS